VIPEPSNADQLLAVVRDWFRLLAAGRWDEASAMADEPNSYGIRWTPCHIRHVLDLSYGPGCRYLAEHPEGPQVSDPDETAGVPHASIVELEDGSGFSVEHDVPLNGSWSELTAQFEFLRRSGGLAVVVHDLHVL
jgi:hypothetical protein